MSEDLFWTSKRRQTKPTTALFSACHFGLTIPLSTSSNINPGSGSRYLPTSLFNLPFLSLTRSILLITQTIDIPRLNIQDMADMTPAKNFVLSCMN